MGVIIMDVIIETDFNFSILTFQTIEYRQQHPYNTHSQQLSIEY